LVDAARAAFLAGGGRASLEAIARDAGVGIGTLYRHFPSRESLIAAVYEEELAAVTATELIDRLLAEHDPAAVALRAWMDRYADFVAAKHGMVEAIRVGVASGDIITGRTRKQVTGTIGRLLAAGVADGSLRDDVQADVVTDALVGVLWSADRGDRAAAAPLLDLVLDGLRPRS